MSQKTGKQSKQIDDFAEGEVLIISLLFVSRFFGGPHPAESRP
jgi:hypothetical protein